MKLVPTNVSDSPQQSQAQQQAGARVILLMLVSFLVGVGATAVWFRIAAKPGAENASASTNDTQPGANASSAAPVANASPAARSFVATPPPATPAAIDAVKRAIPDLASVSLEDGERMLREAAVKEFKAAAQEMQNQIAKAQEELTQAQASKSAVEQQTALKHLQEVQSGQTQKLQQIAADLQAQINALEQLKRPQQ